MLPQQAAGDWGVPHLLAAHALLPLQVGMRLVALPLIQHGATMGSQYRRSCFSTPVQDI